MQPTCSRRPAADGQRRWPDQLAFMNRRLAATLVLLAEVLLAGYLALLAGLLSAWMVDDDRAFRMETADWVVLACQRFGVALVVAVVFAAVARLAHRRWVLSPDSPTWLRTVPLLLGCCIALASAAGSISFVVRKPFI